MLMSRGSPYACVPAQGSQGSTAPTALGGRASSERWSDRPSEEQAHVRQARAEVAAAWLMQGIGSMQGTQPGGPLPGEPGADPRGVSPAPAPPDPGPPTASSGGRPPAAPGRPSGPRSAPMATVQEGPSSQGAPGAGAGPSAVGALVVGGAGAGEEGARGRGLLRDQHLQQAPTFKSGRVSAAAKLAVTDVTGAAGAREGGSTSQNGAQRQGQGQGGSEGVEAPGAAGIPGVQAAAHQAEVEPAGASFDLGSAIAQTQQASPEAPADPLSSFRSSHAPQPE